MEHIFSGMKLYYGNTEVSYQSAMNGKDLMAVYFGAHWVPPCRVFIDHLVKTYQSAGGKLQVVFVSYDGSENAHTSHMAKMP